MRITEMTTEADLFAEVVAQHDEFGEWVFDAQEAAHFGVRECCASEDCEYCGELMEEARRRMALADCDPRPEWIAGQLALHGEVLLLALEERGVVVTQWMMRACQPR